MKPLIYLLTVFLIISCESDPSTKDTEEWCKAINYGLFEGETEDGNKVEVALFETDRFSISYELSDGIQLFITGGYKGYPFLDLDDVSSNIQKNKAIKFSPYGMNYKDEMFSDIYDFDFGEISITYISANQMKLEFPNAQRAIQTLTESKISNDVNSIVLTKTVGISDCYHFDPNVSLNSFTDYDKNFIERDLELGEGWELASKELMMDYMLRKPELESKSWGGWNRSLAEVGSVFKIDLNMDGEEDLCGYFVKSHTSNPDLVFKIFLNNGISYDEVYSVALDDVRSGNGDNVFFPDTLNGKPIIGSSYLDKAGYCLFYNKLSGKIDEKYYD